MNRFLYRRLWIGILVAITLFFILFGSAVLYLKNNDISLEAYRQDVLKMLADAGINQPSLQNLALSWHDGLTVRFDELKGQVPQTGEFTVPRLEIKLSVFAFLQGTLAPRQLTLYSPTFQATYPDFDEGVPEDTPLLPKTLSAFAVLRDSRFFHLNKIEIYDLALGQDAAQNLSLFLDLEKINQRHLVWERLEISLNPSTLSLPRLFEEDLPVNHLNSQGSIDWVGQEFNLATLTFDLEQGTVLELPTKGKWDKTGIHFTTLPQINLLSIETLVKIWPQLPVDNARIWVKNQVLKGEIRNLQGKIVIDVPWDTKQQARILPELKASIADADVMYLPEFPSIVNTQGTLNLEDTNLFFHLQGGTAENISLSESHIKINIPEETITIDATTDGGIENYLKLIQPLNYTKNFDIKPSQLQGNGQVKAHFEFPLLLNIPKGQFLFDVDASLRDVKISDLPLKQTVDQGNFNLTVTSQGLQLQGNGVLGGIAPIDINFNQDFDHSQETLQITGKLRAEDLIKLGLEVDKSYIVGDLPFELSLKDVKDKGHIPELKVDLTETSLSLPFIAWKKAAKTKAELIMSFPKDQPSQWQLQSPNLKLKGSANFNKDRQEIWIDQLKWPGRTDCKVSLAHENNKWLIVVEGEAIDLHPYLEQKKSTLESKTTTETSSAVYTIRGRVNKLWLSDTEIIDQVVTDFSYDQGIWGHLTMDGSYHGHALNVQVKPESPYRAFEASIDNIGGLLRALDITPYVKGGNLTLKGQLINLTGRRHLEGQAQIDEMQITSAPLLLGILNFASVTGALEQLGGEGLYFQKFKADFRLLGEDLTIKDGSLKGRSIGFTFEGLVNLANNTLSLSGVVIPAYLANNFFNNVPLLGELLGGEDEGIFAIAYRASGSFSNPSVTANPLSVVTPGIFRKIFGD